jgi:hypothetical protein
VNLSISLYQSTLNNREDGFFALFAGLSAMLAKQIPYTMSKQVSFDIITRCEVQAHIYANEFMCVWYNMYDMYNKHSLTLQPIHMHVFTYIMDHMCVFL